MSRNNRQPSPGLGRVESRSRTDGLNSQTFLSGSAVQAALGGMGYQVNGRPIWANTAVPYHLPLFNSPKAQALGRLNSEPPTPTAGGINSPSTPPGRTGSQTPNRASGPGSTPLNPTSPKGPAYGQHSFSTAAPFAAGRRSSLSITAPAGSLTNMARSMVETSGVSTVVRNNAATAQLNLSLPLSRPSSSGSFATMTTTLSRPGTATSSTPRLMHMVPGLALSHGSNQSMGCRGYQEDFRHVLDPSSMPGLSNLPNILLAAAVYDGHGGKQVSQWLTQQYCLLNRSAEAVQGLVSGGGDPKDIAPTLDDVFVACGTAALSTRMTAGSCVAVALLMHAGGVPWVVSANVGDSRTVLVSWDDDGGRVEVAQLSIDHKLGPPKLNEESRRVQAAGGTVIQLFGTWRIDGSLAVARAIGDADFARYVSYRPTVSCRQMQRRDRWLIIGSDGLYDVMTNEEIAMFCKGQHQLSATKMAEALVREAVRNRGSGDNTTVVAVRLQYTPPGGGG